MRALWSQRRMDGDAGRDRPGTEGAAARLMTANVQIDTTHSSVDFSIRHLVIAKVRGRFTRFSGTIGVRTPAQAAA